MNSKNILVLTSLGCITLLGLILYSYRYVEGISKESSDEYSALIAEVEILKERSDNLNKSNTEFAALEDTRLKLPSILPPTKVQSDIVAQIIQNANDNQISLQRITFPSSRGDDFDSSQTEPLDDIEGVNKIEMQIKFSTNFGTMLEFIKDIEENQRISQIDNINLVATNSSVTDPDEVELSVELQIDIYVRPKAETTDSGDEADKTGLGNDTSTNRAGSAGSEKSND